MRASLSVTISGLVCSIVKPRALHNSLNEEYEEPFSMTLWLYCWGLFGVYKAQSKRGEGGSNNKFWFGFNARRNTVEEKGIAQ